MYQSYVVEQVSYKLAGNFCLCRNFPVYSHTYLVINYVVEYDYFDLQNSVLSTLAPTFLPVSSKHLVVRVLALAHD